MTTPAKPVQALTPADVSRARDVARRMLAMHWRASVDRGGPTEVCVVDVTDVVIAVVLQAVHGTLAPHPPPARTPSARRPSTRKGSPE